MARRRRESENFELMLIPMIDIMLILLIFFMVATTIKQSEKALPIQLPAADASVSRHTEDNLLVLGVDRAGHRYVNGQIVTTEALQSELRQAASKSTTQPIRLDADKDTRYEDLTEVIDLCQFEGLHNINLHTRSARPQ